MLKRTRVFLRILLTRYLWPFATKNKAFFAFRRVPEAAICKSFRERKRKEQKNTYGTVTPLQLLDFLVPNWQSRHHSSSPTLSLHIAKTQFFSFFFFRYSLDDADRSQLLLYRSSFLLLYSIVLQLYSVSSIFPVLQFPVIERDARFGLAGSGAYYRH